MTFWRHPQRPPASRIVHFLGDVMYGVPFLQVASDGVAVCHLEPKQFVGSMAFSRFISNVNVNVKPETAPSPPASTSSPQGNTAAAADGDAPSKLQGGDAGPVATSALSTEVVGDSDVDDEDDDQLEYIDDMYVPGGAGVFEEAREAALGLLRQDSFVGDVAKSFVAESGFGKGPCGLESSLTSVTATTDVSAGTEPLEAGVSSSQPPHWCCCCCCYFILGSFYLFFDEGFSVCVSRVCPTRTRGQFLALCVGDFVESGGGIRRHAVTTYQAIPVLMKLSVNGGVHWVPLSHGTTDADAEHMIVLGATMAKRLAHEDAADLTTREIGSGSVKT